MNDLSTITFTTAYRVLPPMSFNDQDRVAGLRAQGFKVSAGDEEQGGLWLARGGKCQWFDDPASAARAVERGWPWLR